MPILSLSLFRKHQPITNPTTPLQHIRILGRIIAFTRNIRTPQFKLRRQRSLASPLDIIVIVVGTCIGATHHIYFVEGFCIAAHALELGDWGAAACAGFLARAESETGDFGEEDAVRGFAEGVG
jgi:hypothetical protein